MLRPGRAISLAVKRSFDFRGRARRSEFWWFNAFVLLGASALAMIEIYIFPADTNLNEWGYPNSQGFQRWIDNWKYYGLSTAFTYLTLPAFLSVAMRRLHDIGRRGWPAIIIVITAEILDLLQPYSNLEDAFSNSEYSAFGIFNYISPVFLSLAVIYFLFIGYLLLSSLRDSHPNDNRFGSSPKYNAGVDVFD